EGGLVTVAGSAEVYEAQPGAVYVWSLRVFGDVPGKKPLLREHHYEDRAVWMGPGQRSMQPEFRDTFQWEPGAYRVELTLYATPADFTFRGLAFGADLRMKLSGVAGRRRIRVD